MSVDGESSPKRARFNSYSPASPAPVDLKTYPPPQTPPPSVRMSPSWQSQNSNPLKRSYDTSIGGDDSVLTPPSTAGLTGQTGSSLASQDAHGEHKSDDLLSSNRVNTKQDNDGDSAMDDGSGRSFTDHTAFDAEHRRTNHERYPESGNQVKTPVVKLGPLYKLSTAPVTRSQPHASDNMIALYNLQDIQASVARYDPITGKKTGLRKSYNGKLKTLGLEGQPDAKPNQRELEGLAEDAWDEPGPDGKTYFDMFFDGIELGNAAAESEIMASLGAAFTFDIGQLSGPDDKSLKLYLGLDDGKASAPKNAKGTPQQSAMRPTAAAIALAKTAPNVVQRASAPASPANSANRPDRANKRRRYDDSSFEGYDNDDGYSTGGVDDRGTGGPKRQKRKEFSSSSNSSGFASGSNNGNMIGVRGS